jgi:hypothetical protein
MMIFGNVELVWILVGGGVASSSFLSYWVAFV